MGERNETYKHLEDPIRLGQFTVGQVASLFVTSFAAVMFGLYLSPLPPGPTITVSVLMAGLPVALSYAVGGSDMAVAYALTSIYRWMRGVKHYLPGGGERVAGYVVTPPVVVERPAVRPAEDAAMVRRELEGAWDG